MRSIQAWGVVGDKAHLAGKTHHLEIARHAHDGHVRVAQQLRVKVLPARGAKVQRALAHEHHVDDADLGVALLVHRGKRHVLDLAKRL